MAVLTFVRCRAGIYPPTFFSPGPADPIPPDEGGGGRRGNNNDDTMASCRGSRAIIAPRAVRLILSGIPLSLTITAPLLITIRPPKGIRERGICFEKYFIKNCYSVAVSRALVVNIEFGSKFHSRLTYGEVRSS